MWFADRWFRPELAGGALLRRRRQHRHDDRLCIQFDYRSPTGASLHTTTVEVALFTAADLSGAFTTAGFGHGRFLPGHGGLSEILTISEVTP